MARGREFLEDGVFDGEECEVFLGFDQASSHVQWLVIRKNSSFLRKGKLGTFTTVRFIQSSHPPSFFLS